MIGKIWSVKFNLETNNPRPITYTVGTNGTVKQQPWKPSNTFGAAHVAMTDNEKIFPSCQGTLGRQPYFTGPPGPPGPLVLHNFHIS